MNISRMLSRMLMVGMVALPLNMHSAAWAQDRTITVIGVGSASATPNLVRVKGIIEGRGKDASTAYESYRGTKTALQKKLADNEEGKVSLSFLGEIITTPSESLAARMAIVAAPGGAAAAAPSEIVVRESIEVRIAMENDMERMQISAKIAEALDEAKDAGVVFKALSSSAMVTPFQQQNYLAEFSVKNGEALRDRAFEAAMKNARRRAKTLAALAGGSLGHVVSVEESRLDEEENPLTAAILLSSGQQADTKSEFSSNENREIEFKQHLKVVFELK